jgi:tellurite resistance protein TehA-like permease
MPIADSRDAPRRSAFSRLALAIPGGSFAFVMATGIVAIAAASQGLRPIGASLFAINLVAVAVLSLLMLLRLIRDRAALIAEISHHRTAAGFLTIVAGAAMLGNEFVVQVDARPVGAGLWLAACGLWVGFVYAFFTVLATRPRKPSLADGLDGAWLLAAVATEALAVLGAHVAGCFARPDIVVYLSLCWFLLGGFFI